MDNKLRHYTPCWLNKIYNWLAQIPSIFCLVCFRVSIKTCFFKSKAPQKKSWLNLWFVFLNTISPSFGNTWDNMGFNLQLSTPYFWLFWVKIVNFMKNRLSWFFGTDLNHFGIKSWTSHIFLILSVSIDLMICQTIYKPGAVI